MEDSTREIGGNKIAIWYGNLLGKISGYYKRRSDKFIKKGSKTLVSNPTCKFINPFTMIYTFTVDNVDKCQLITQSDYRDRYIAWRDKQDSYTERLLAFEKELVEYNNLDDDEGVDIPVAPNPLDTSPLSVNEMFMVILSRDNAWFKKNN